MIDTRTLTGQAPHPKPIVEITVDGKIIANSVMNRLISLTHTDNRGFEADSVEITLDDSDGKLELPARGVLISLAIGWKAEGLVNKGLFTVDEVSHSGVPDVLSIRANSADLRTGLTTQHERSWDNITLSAIVATIAAENDLKPLIHASFYSVFIEHIDQTNESSVNLLTRLAQQHDAIATVKNGCLMFIPSGSGETASGKAIPTVKIVRKDGDRHQFGIADRQTYNAVRATYYDTNLGVKGEVIWGNTEDGAERNVQPKPPEKPPVGQLKALPKTYPTRDKALRAARKAWAAMAGNKAERAAYIGVKASYNDRNLKQKSEVSYGQSDEEKRLRAAAKTKKRDEDKIAEAGGDKEPVNAFTHSADNLKTLRHVYASKANAARAARAEWRRLQRGMATFTITLAYGLPELFPETPAIVSGFKAQIDNTDWIITRVVNLIGDGGYTQQLEFEIKATEIPD